MLHTLTMLRKLAFAALILLAAFSGVLVAKFIVDPPQYTPIAQAGGMTVANPRQIPDYSMVDMNGQPFKLSNIRGRATLIFFGYTFCPDVCPLTLAELKQVKAALGSQASEVTFLYITVDPERDSPDVLKRYISAFDPDFVSATGEIDTLRRFATEFGAAFEKQKPAGTSAGYLVAHTSFTYLLDRQGRWRTTFAFQTPVDAVARDTLRILQER